VGKVTRAPSQSGFSLIELLIATGLILIIASTVTGALLQMTKHQQTVWNRTEMHSGIRGATELMQQEVGQAGRIALGGAPTLAAAVTAAASCDPTAPATNAVTVAVNSTVTGVSAVSGMFATAGPPAAYEMLTTLDGDNQESFRLSSFATSPATITACFTKSHAVGTVLAPLGGFATGIVPPSGLANGSDGYHLKMYGDINSDGQMVYVEYLCDNGDLLGPSASHNLYRNVMAYDAASKPPTASSQILLGNIQSNPPPSGSTTPVPCFTYQTSTISVSTTPFTFVLDVAITLTVQTEQVDQVTKAYQTETKALLNVSPRNVFNTWEYAGMGYTERIQSTPLSITALLPPVP